MAPVEERIITRPMPAKIFRRSQCSRISFEKVRSVIQPMSGSTKMVTARSAFSQLKERNQSALHQALAMAMPAARTKRSPHLRPRTWRARRLASDSPVEVISCSVAVFRAVSRCSSVSRRRSSTSAFSRAFLTLRSRIASQLALGALSCLLSPSTVILLALHNHNRNMATPDDGRVVGAVSIEDDGKCVRGDVSGLHRTFRPVK